MKKLVAALVLFALWRSSRKRVSVTVGEISSVYDPALERVRMGFNAGLAGIV